MSIALGLIWAGIVLCLVANGYFQWQIHKETKRAQQLRAETALLIADIDAMTSDPTRKKGKTK